MFKTICACTRMYPHTCVAIQPPTPQKSLCVIQRQHSCDMQSLK